ncbi:MAG: glycosyltransferase family 4 protein [Nanoarchaeota archaeon]|nr:glycosyltransferase family 4 protein [Nanoarchaeota archaeon]
MIKKPNITIIHYSCPPIVGGVETVIEEHAELFSSRGYKINLIVGKGEKFDKNVPVAIIPEMYSLENINNKINGELDKNIVSDLFNKRVETLYKKLKKKLSKTDVCIIHNILTMHLNMPLTAALVKIIKDTNIKFISWSHDATFNDPLYNIKKRTTFPYNFISQQIKKVTYVTVSNYRQNKLSNLFKVNKKNIKVIPNGINLVKLLNLNKHSLKIFEDFNLFREDLVMFAPTRIVKRKNLKDAIKITLMLNKLGKKSKLIVTGPPNPHILSDREYYAELKKLAKDKVIFLHEYKLGGKRGHIDQGIIRDLYILCDLLLFPSSEEGFGIPLLEAGIFNLLIICSNIEPFKELCGKDVFYIDIMKKDYKKIAKDIIKYFDSHLTVNMFKKVVRNYRWESIFETEIEPLINSLKR